MRKGLSVVALAFWAALLILPVFVFAAGESKNTNTTAPITISFPNPLGSCSSASAAGGGQLSCVLNKIIDGLIVLAIPVVGLLVIFAAYQIMTAAGDPEKFKTGTKTLMYTAIGFAIMLLSKGVAYILQDILGA